MNQEDFKLNDMLKVWTGNTNKIGSHKSIQKTILNKESEMRLRSQRIILYMNLKLEMMMRKKRSKFVSYVKDWNKVKE